MCPEEFTILTPNAMLGYGYQLDHFWYGIEKYKPAAIIVDSGSTDGGPYKLGLGKMTCGRGSYLRDLEPMLDAAFHKKIKVIISSVGGDGSRKHVAEMLDMVAEISQRKNYSFKVATIDANVDRELLHTRHSQGRIHPCGPVPEATVEDIDSAIEIVAQMGAEPCVASFTEGQMKILADLDRYMLALQQDPDIILGGRSYDPAPFAAFCLSRGCLPGVSWHMGKIMECGGICAVPKGRSMIATMRYDSFDLTPLASGERCTPMSVAAHTLYEKTRPDRLPGPGGILELTSASYEQVTEKSTRIKGAHFVPSTTYQIKLEGVAHLGYRTIFVGGIRDPILIAQIDDFLERVRTYTQKLFPELDQSENCRLIYHIYGRNAVMGPLEPLRHQHGHEIGVVGEVLAPTQELSHTIANNARASILHFSYPGQKATTGNFASPFSPHEQEAGACFKFSLYHLVDLESAEVTSLFPVTMHRITAASPASPCPSIGKEAYRALESGPLTPMVQEPAPLTTTTMSEVARIIRSKNSGPFELTLDIMFDSQEKYDRVKGADLLTNNVVKALYGISSDDDILTNMYFDPALAWKCTIRRPWAQGSVGERDTLGTQQHAPLLDIEIPAVSLSGADGDPIRNGTKHSTNGNGFIHDVQSHLSTVDQSTSNGMRQQSRNERPTHREHFTTLDSLLHIWSTLGLPPSALQSLRLPNVDEPGLPSSYKIGHLAQASIGLSALLAAQIGAHRNNTPVPTVTVPLRHACAEFKSERLYVLDGHRNEDPWGPIGGLHKAVDGYVRIHDSFPSHRDGALEMLGLTPGIATRADVSNKTQDWKAIDLEVSGVDSKLVISALRSYQEWDVLPQSKAIADFPISLRAVGKKSLPKAMPPSSRCLQGLRVVEMSRVIAAPLAGKTLAAHGADVIWITSPNLPDLPAMDRDFARGKRTVQLDAKTSEGREKLLKLIATADVFLQGFRPGALERLGLGKEQLRAANPDLIVANMSAYGTNGPWAGRRGFDSIIQTCSGMNISEAEHAGEGQVARPAPCQALDHAGGYFLASGIMAAVYKRMTIGGAYDVDVSLAACMKYLRSLGQYEGRTGFQVEDITDPEQIEDLMESSMSGFGELKAVKHSATIEGFRVGWDVMPKPLGSDEPVWTED